MNIKITFDQDENVYIAFVDMIPAICGYGESEKFAILDLLKHALHEEGFNHKVIQHLIDKMENEN